jgi:hypothetical protein
MFGFLILLFRVNTYGSVSGLSKNSIICYTICVTMRFFSISFWEGYLPYDKTGDLIYRISEFVTMCCCGMTLYYIHSRYKKSYNWDLDTFTWYFFAIPTFIFAVLFHPALNSFFLADIPWTYSLYLESLAMFPQLDLFRKKGGEIETFTSHYVASSGVSRIL